MGLTLHLCHLLGLALHPGRVGKESLCLLCDGETVMGLEAVDGLTVSRDRKEKFLTIWACETGVDVAGAEVSGVP